MLHNNKPFLGIFHHDIFCFYGFDVCAQAYFMINSVFNFYLLR